MMSASAEIVFPADVVQPVTHRASKFPVGLEQRSIGRVGAYPEAMLQIEPRRDAPFERGALAVALYAEAAVKHDLRPCLAPLIGVVQRIGGLPEFFVELAELDGWTLPIVSRTTRSIRLYWAPRRATDYGRRAH